MKTYHRHKFEWGYRDYYFQLGRCIEYVKRLDSFYVQDGGHIMNFEDIASARRWVRCNPLDPIA